MWCARRLQFTPDGRILTGNWKRRLQRRSVGQRVAPDKTKGRHVARRHVEANSARLRNFPGRELLTPREGEVLSRIADGASNKEAGRQLGISPRTVEVHRARIMEKLGAKNAADLVRIVLSERRDS